MKLTCEQLEDIAVLSNDRLRSTFLTPLNITMEKYQINTPLRVAAFLAQILHESMYFKYTEEIADGSAYEYRKDLGNLEPIALKIAHAHGSTTGRFYKGRSLIMLTGYFNYVKISKALSTEDKVFDCVNSPKLLCLPEYATLSAGWFFNTHNCNSLADVEEFKQITRVINGGYNGLAERTHIYEVAKKVLM